MSTSTINPLDRLLKMAEGVQEARNALLEQRAELMVAVREVEDQLRRVERIARAAGVVEPPQRGPSKIKPRRASEESLQRVMRVMKSSPDKTFSTVEIANLTDLSKSTAVTALETLRDDGLVRLIGVAPRVAGQKGQAPKAYKLMRNGE